MPSGYTAGVQDGSIKTFEEYALGCARAFGACITLRDEPQGAEIPEFAVDDFYTRRLSDANNELASFKAMTDGQLRAVCEKEWEEEVRAASAKAEKKREEENRYRSMLDQARKYRPPTKDHAEFAKFMVDQLEESIRFDCYEVGFPEKLSFEEWRIQRSADLSKNVRNAQQSLLEEVARVKSRNEWVNAVKESLKRGLHSGDFFFEFNIGWH